MRGVCRAIAALLFLALPCAAAEVDYAIYGELLANHVQQGVVDYRGLKKDEGGLDAALKDMAELDLSDLSTNQFKALCINAYNAWTIKLILMHYPGISSIKQIGGVFSGPWKQKIVHLGGKVLSLGELEHDILRPKFKDPRIHFAINCASRGCPPLLNRPYRGKNLDRTLDEVTAAFINAPRRTVVKSGKLYLSKIMDWFSRDFNDDQVGFVLHYADPGLQRRIQSLGGHIEIDFLDYDWSLNGK